MKTIKIDPVPKPRKTQSDRWKKRPVVIRYRSYADDLRLKCRLGGITLFDKLHAQIVIKMPKSWSKKKQLEMDGKPHQQTPDVDNLVKAILDSLLSEDSTVWDLNVSKRWGHKGSITFL